MSDLIKLRNTEAERLLDDQRTWFEERAKGKIDR
jgi:hypothetical protein